MSEPKSKMSYEDFVGVFEEARKEHFKPPDEDVGYPMLEFDHLKPEEAENKLRENVIENAEFLQKVPCTIVFLWFAKLPFCIL